MLVIGRNHFQLAFVIRIIMSSLDPATLWFNQINIIVPEAN